MIGLTARAARQVRALRDHYEDRQRPEAVARLMAALVEAMQRIAENPGAGSPAPRPYPGLVRDGRRWIKSGRYWVAYTTDRPPLIVGVFFETADIPKRF